MLTLMGQEWRSTLLLADVEIVANWVFFLCLFMLIPALLLLNATNWVKTHFGSERQMTSAEREVAMMSSTADEIKERSGMRQEQRSKRRHG